jgi:S-adenosylmethionine:tRNA ribosyltransferase-isomerase
LRGDETLVFNNTKVIPARLFGNRGDARIELLLHQNIDGNKWLVFAKPAKRLRIGDVVEFAAEFSAAVLEKRESGEVLLEFICDNLPAMLAKHGHMPLPPYIKRSDSNNDRSDYQTIYAKHDGAVAAPTAGLHFTPELMAVLKISGIEMLEVTLHVGAGTFLPVKVDDISEHKMHSEWGEIDAATAAKINTAKAEGRRIVAVGTTSLRLLESAADGSKLRPFHGSTAIFITPGYDFRIVDVLLTNFHLPRSTLFMLVSAFMGLEKMQASYQHAIETGYRFYSYGDACLLERK